MNLKIIAYYLSIVIFITGCIHSVNPLYTENDIITNDQIIDTWEEPLANIRESLTSEKKKQGV